MTVVVSTTVALRQRNKLCTFPDNPSHTTQDLQSDKIRKVYSCKTTHNMLKSCHRPGILLLLLFSLTFIPQSSPSLPSSGYIMPRKTIPDPAYWSEDYETRLQLAITHGRSRPKTIFVRWLHSPKTGTSFANTLIRWGCPTAGDTFVTPRKERPENLTHPVTPTHSWDWLFLNASGRTWLRAKCTPRLSRKHSGQMRYALCMHKALERWEVRHAVGLFRMPLQRMYSNYVHLSKHYNESRAPRESLATFVKRTEFWGQQSKLLLGQKYRHTKVVTSDEAIHAATIVRKMLFVGLTEEFQLSCRLFHAMFGGVPHRAQFENVRPGIDRYREEAKRAAGFRYDEDVFNGWRDEADDIVYQAARERFWADVLRYEEEIVKDGLGKVKIPQDKDITFRTS